MRIARVLHERSPLPVIALERDGALYDVEALDEHLQARRSPDPLVAATDFFTRVIALRCAGLAALDERLCAGKRPTEARLLPGSFLWLPPCDTDRSLYVHVELASSSEENAEPSYWIGNARGMLGHDATVAFPPHETRPTSELGIAAVLCEDLRRATADEAEDALVGYAILNTWTARDAAKRHQNPGQTCALGPMLVTRADAGDVARLRMQARIDGQVVANGTIGLAGACLPKRSPS